MNRWLWDYFDPYRSESVLDRFSVRMSPGVRVLLFLTGAVPSNCIVEVSDAELRVHFGLYKTIIPRGDLSSVKSVSWALWNGLGFRVNLRDVLGLIGSTRGVVQMTLREKSVSLMGMRCDTVSSSNEDPEGFILALEPIMHA